MKDAVAMQAAAIDLTDLDLFATGDPLAAWRWLRRNAPVHWHGTGEGGGFWALTRHADVAAAYLDHVSFSSARGPMLGGSYQRTDDTSSGRMLVATDLPQHRLLRQQVHQGFTPMMVRSIEGALRALLDPAIDRMLEAGGCDFAVDVALALPASVLTAMLGLSPAEAHRVLALTRAMIGSQDEEYRRAGRREDLALLRAQTGVFAFFAELVERRRREPGDDLVSLLLRSEVNGRAMSDAEILYNCMNVAVGGNETTPHTASGGVLALIEHPEEHERLRADPSLLPLAIEEILRWTSANAYVLRVATRDVEIRGRRIREGDVVTLWNASANRDEEVFHDAEHFDAGRRPNRHLAFGAGHHHCIGAAVARTELSVLFERLLARDVRLRLAGPVERLRSNFMLGIKHLPVTAAGA